MNYNYTEEILKYKRNKKLKGIFIGIGILLVAIIGSTYAFFTYSKSLQAFTLTSSGINFKPHKSLGLRRKLGVKLGPGTFFTC